MMADARQHGNGSRLGASGWRQLPGVLLVAPSLERALDEAVRMLDAPPPAQWHADSTTVSVFDPAAGDDAIATKATVPMRTSPCGALLLSVTNNSGYAHHAAIVTIARDSAALRRVDCERRVIIVHNVGSLAAGWQNALKRHMETYMASALFIMTCTRMGGVAPALSSRAAVVRLWTPHDAANAMAGVDTPGAAKMDAAMAAYIRACASRSMTRTCLRELSKAHRALVQLHSDGAASMRDLLRAAVRHAPHAASDASDASLSERDRHAHAFTVAAAEGDAMVAAITRACDAECGQGILISQQPQLGVRFFLAAVRDTLRFTARP